MSTLCFIPHGAWGSLKIPVKMVPWHFESCGSFCMRCGTARLKLCGTCSGVNKRSQNGGCKTPLPWAASDSTLTFSALELNEMQYRTLPDYKLFYSAENCRNAWLNTLGDNYLKTTCCRSDPSSLSSIHHHWALSCRSLAQRFLPRHCRRRFALTDRDSWTSSSQNLSSSPHLWCMVQVWISELFVRQIREGRHWGYFCLHHPDRLSHTCVARNRMLWIRGALGEIICRVRWRLKSRLKFIVLIKSQTKGVSTIQFEAVSMHDSERRFRFLQTTFRSFFTKVAESVRERGKLRSEEQGVWTLNWTSELSFLWVLFFPFVNWTKFQRALCAYRHKGVWGRICLHFWFDIASRDVGRFAHQRRAICHATQLAVKCGSASDRRSALVPAGNVTAASVPVQNRLPCESTRPHVNVNPASSELSRLCWRVVLVFLCKVRSENIQHPNFSLCSTHWPQREAMFEQKVTVGQR